MPPRPAPDLDTRRDRISRAAREVAESEGWAAVTMRRLAAELGVTQPVLYTAFASRQALIDSVALTGFDEIAAVLGALDADAMVRMRAYLDFAVAHPRTYEAMFSMPSGLPFASDRIPPPLQAAFSAVRDAFPGADDLQAEVAWSTLHGLATLQAGGRLRAEAAHARLELVHRMLTRQETR